MFAKKTVKDVDVRGKRVLVRVDFNVPLAEGAVTDDTRIRAALPTIRYLIDHGARVVLVSHLGRPKGEPDPQFSLKPVRRVLQRLIGRNVAFSPDIVGPEADEAVDRMIDGEILMLENVRFDPGEKTNDPEFAQQARGARRHLRERRVRRGASCARVDRGRGGVPARVRGHAARARGRDAHATCSPTRSARSWRSSAAAR